MIPLFSPCLLACLQGHITHLRLQARADSICKSCQRLFLKDLPRKALFKIGLRRRSTCFGHIRAEPTPPLAPVTKTFLSLKENLSIIHLSLSESYHQYFRIAYKLPTFHAPIHPGITIHKITISFQISKGKYMYGSPGGTAKASIDFTFLFL